MAYTIKTEDLTKRFGELNAVNHVSFKVEDGEIFGLLGPNGAGKTTTINMLCTLLLPSEGSAKVGGYDVVKDADQVRRMIGVVTEKLIMYDLLTPIENLKMFGKLYGVPSSELNKKIEELLRFVELWDWRKSLVGNFSSGMRQRLNVVRALVHNPKILFLDEPTLGLDPTTARKIRGLIKQLNEEGITILLTTHYMDEADKLSHRIGIIDHGKIIALDTPAALKASVGEDATLEDVFIKLTGEKMRDTPKNTTLLRPHRRFRFGGHP